MSDHIRMTTMIRNRHGAALALVAVSLVVILGMGALAVDMGMLIKQREDAQRAADAAALAGASAYQNSLALDAVVPAKDRAFSLLAANYVGGTYIDTSGQTSTVVGGNRYITTSREGTVIVLPDSWKVRVIVRRPVVGTLFARVLGILNVPIAAKAAAEATTAGAGKCLKPFALPDIWADADNDANHNRLEDMGPDPKNPEENWRYNTTDGDSYRALGSSGGGPETGWGSDYRNNYTDEQGNRYLNDYGRQILLKVTSSHDTPSPSFFQAWAIGDDRGGDAYRWNISHCNLSEVALSTDVDFDATVDSETSEPGNMVGPTFQGMTNLIAQDPNACWFEKDDPNHTGYKTGSVGLMTGSGCGEGNYPGWEDSPRVITVPLFSPDQIQSGRTQLAFNNLGVFFIEGQATKDDPVVARFLYYARGTGAGPTQGSLVKLIRLVE